MSQFLEAHSLFKIALNRSYVSNLSKAENGRISYWNQRGPTKKSHVSTAGKLPALFFGIRKPLNKSLKRKSRLFQGKETMALGRLVGPLEIPMVDHRSMILDGWMDGRLDCEIDSSKKKPIIPGYPIG